VTSLNWQGSKFAAILDLAAANFETIRIDVTDALYRHNFMAEGVAPEQALAHAKSLGALWLAQQQDIIDSCPVKPEIIRWAEWYEKPGYQDILEQFRHACAINPILNEAVHKDAVGFYRRKNREASPNEIKCAKEYLIEEMAVVTLQARTLDSVKIYPGEDLLCLHAVRHGLVTEAPKGLEREQFAKVKLEKRLAAVDNGIRGHKPDNQYFSTAC
jgi:tRNA-dependent cyclodipeptide synthase